ncbi:MAG: hypothetical protein P8179_17415 [Candidatus Thiodiazotropha sp.]|jgi:hypothetical protein
MKKIASIESDMKLSRRDFILLVVSGLAVVTLEGCGALLTSNSLTHQLAETIGYPDAARHFGRIYLEGYPDEAKIELLVERIDVGLIAEQGQDMSHEDPLRLAKHLDDQVRSDYCSGEVVRVDGWLLSRTEARIYACFALL